MRDDDAAASAIEETARAQFAATFVSPGWDDNAEVAWIDWSTFTDCVNETVDPWLDTASTFDE